MNDARGDAQDDRATAAAVADVVANVATVRARIADAARRARRDPASVRLVAATKTVEVARVRAVIEAGVVDVGENRAQELLAKAPGCTDLPARWHFLGRVQRNKVRALAPHVQLWQSVERGALGEELARRTPGVHVLVEVNLGDEPQKGGCAPADVAPLVDRLVALDLRVDGLMTVPPHDGDPRRWFSSLRDLAERVGVAELSMGMTADYDVAVEEGATMVRVGRALFGPRG